ncbi:MAG: hypothetical protein Q8M16_04610, partial [Pirellulaceae bacterium]|nr:hypothetical protein [Pirellulaceae bacterium]
MIWTSNPDTADIRAATRWLQPNTAKLSGPDGSGTGAWLGENPTEHTPLRICPEISSGFRWIYQYKG